MTENNILYKFSLTKDSDTTVYGKYLGFMVKWLFIVMFICSVPFFILTFTKDPGFIFFGIIFLLLGVLFGPYANRLKKSYSVIYYDNDIIQLKSTINFILNNYKVNLKEISLIEPGNPLKAQAILFKDAGGKVKSRFNHILMGDEEYFILQTLIKTRNNHIQFKS